MRVQAHQWSWKATSNLAAALDTQHQADPQYSQLDPGQVVRAAASSLAMADCYMSPSCLLMVDSGIFCRSACGHLHSAH